MTDTNQPTHHDDCEDCRRERKENEQYIAVYQRMQNLRKNVEKTATAVRNHSQEMRTVRILSKSLDASMIKTARCQGENDSRSIESVGFEIASCLIQRQARKKMEEENEYLRKRIQSMRKRQQTITHDEPFCCLPKINESRNKMINGNHLSKMVNEIENKKPALHKQPQYQTNNGWNNGNNNVGENDSDSCSTKLSFFKNTRPFNSSTYRQRYRNMNLWLYQRQNFNDSKQNIQEQPIPPTTFHKRTKRH